MPHHLVILQDLNEFLCSFFALRNKPVVEMLTINVAVSQNYFQEQGEITAIRKEFCILNELSRFVK